MQIEILTANCVRKFFGGQDGSQLVVRIKELLASNGSLRTEKFGLCLALWFPVIAYHWAAVPTIWEMEGFEGVTSDSLFLGIKIIRDHFIPDFNEGTAQSVGARKEYKLIYTTSQCLNVVSYINEERAAAYHHAMLDTELGDQCEIMLNRFRAYDYSSHFEMGHLFGDRVDHVISQEAAYAVLEYSGNVPVCREIVAIQLKAFTSYIEDTHSQSFVDLPLGFIHEVPALVDFTAACTDDSFRSGIYNLLKLVGCSDSEDCKEWVKTSKDWAGAAAMTLSSSDGKHHSTLPESIAALVCSFLSLTSPESSKVSIAWLDELAEPSSPLHHDNGHAWLCHVNLRVLVSG